MSTLVLNNTKKLSFKIQAFAALAATVCAVAVPQIFHLMGAVSGLGTALGETFLPMHLPIILVGLLAGPYAGALAGALGPVISFLLSGMPTALMLPFMVAELCAYGLLAGLLREVRMPTFFKVLAVQIGGRAVRAIAILAAVYGFGSAAPVASIWKSILTGIIGLALQWALLPLVVYRVEHADKR